MNPISRMQRVSIIAITAACTIAIAGRAFSADMWQVETVDTSGSAKFTSLKIDSNGNVHVAYIPETDRHPLKYGYWDHALKKWFTMTVADYASFCTLTLDSKQRPRISYADHGTGLGAKLRYASWDGSAWRVQPIPIEANAVVAYYTSVALDANDRPSLSFYDYADPSNNFRLRLRSVFWRDDHWEVHTADPLGGSGKFNVIAIDSKGNPHIAYANVKFENSSLRYATWNGKRWDVEVIEGAAGPFPVYSVGMILDKNDDPHIAYTDMERRLVKYATRRGGKWVISTIDSIRQPAYPDRDGIVVDSDGNPYVSYYDEGQGILKIAYLRNGKWIGEILDRNYAGFTSSLAIDGDTLWVSYADEPGMSLKVAHRRMAGMETMQSGQRPPAASTVKAY